METTTRHQGPETGAYRKNTWPAVFSLEPELRWGGIQLTEQERGVLHADWVLGKNQLC